MGRLTGKVAIVTGAARGMGACTARLFVEEGAVVVLGDVLDEQGQALAQELGDNAHYLHLDVSQEADWSKAVALAESLGSLQVLVNNAAILYAASIADTSAADYRRVVDVNQVGAFLGIRAVMEPMKRAGKGSIINISSIDGFQAKNDLSAYASTKWALRGLSKAAAIELGRFGIRVNTVHPGGVNTVMGNAAADSEESLNQFYTAHAIPRVGRPEEVARMTLFVASDEASYSTGCEFLVDGGWNAGLRIPTLPGA